MIQRQILFYSNIPLFIKLNIICSTFSSYYKNKDILYCLFVVVHAKYKNSTPVKGKSPQQISCVGASITLTCILGNLHWSLEQVKIGIMGRQSSCDAGVWLTQGPHFPSKQEEQEQGYPSVIFSTAVKPWEALDLDCWPERRKLEVIAASAVVWRHNL